eukprot:764935-Hanusia_phi.AAC.2
MITIIIVIIINNNNNSNIIIIIIINDDDDVMIIVPAQETDSLCRDALGWLHLASLLRAVDHVRPTPCQLQGGGRGRDKLHADPCPAVEVLEVHGVLGGRQQRILALPRLALRVDVAELVDAGDAGEEGAGGADGAAGGRGEGAEGDSLTGEDVEVRGVDQDEALGRGEGKLELVPSCRRPDGEVREDSDTLLIDGDGGGAVKRYEGEATAPTIGGHAGLGEQKRGDRPDEACETRSSIRRTKTASKKSKRPAVKTQQRVAREGKAEQVEEEEEEEVEDEVKKVEEEEEEEVEEEKEEVVEEKAGGGGCTPVGNDILGDGIAESISDGDLRLNDKRLVREVVQRHGCQHDWVVWGGIADEEDVADG